MMGGVGIPFLCMNCICAGAGAGAGIYLSCWSGLGQRLLVMISSHSWINMHYLSVNI